MFILSEVKSQQQGGSCCLWRPHDTWGREEAAATEEEQVLNPVVFPLTVSGLLA